ncbi:response regulator transcription factor [Arthrobacter sp. Marseille-P9274]|uniref:response regulator transcription factor n=1 Tax=Arthrobacter sp. Marseille-P9274 TaxID=2866572 RepID=UPI0021C5C3A7|nr:response regulator transcription factor [Arthrobacter sp. Marseille-P9274]
MSDPIRILLADDEPLIRSGLSAILSMEEDLAVVGEAGDGAEVWTQVRQLEPDVVMMDVRMPRMDGIEATAQLVANSERLNRVPRILILTTFESDDYVYDALRAGADGFLLKRARPDELIRTVRAVAAGESIVFPAKLRELVAGRQSRGQGVAAGGPATGQDLVSRAGLSAREAEVLRHVAEGCSNQEIAALMFLGIETVKSHIGSILAKLGVRDRTQAVIAAYESGFIRPGQ